MTTGYLIQSIREGIKVVKYQQKIRWHDQFKIYKKVAIEDHLKWRKTNKVKIDDFRS